MGDIPISYITGQNSAPGPASKPATNTLDGQDFMNLLIAQLKYQDPTSPMDTTAMMQQSSTLSMVEQMTAMADDSAESFGLQQRMAATQLVGQKVTWTDPTTNAATSGVVTSVSYTSAG
ncbi:MAG: flagellar hook capping protein, partial [Actinobacteria bacterium]|nr:flagellar hook capping protein [Actinomycetota bacterium]